MKKVPNILVPAFQRNGLRLLDTKKLLLTLRKLAYINMSSLSCRYNAGVTRNAFVNIACKRLPTND